MVIKVLFFDTSALLKMFINEDGTEKVMWLTSPDTKMLFALHFVVNEQVCSEFEKKVRQFAGKKITNENVASFPHIKKNIPHCWSEYYFKHQE